MVPGYTNDIQRTYIHHTLSIQIVLQENDKYVNKTYVYFSRVVYLLLILLMNIIFKQYIVKKF